MCTPHTHTTTHTYCLRSPCEWIRTLKTKPHTHGLMHILSAKHQGRPPSPSAMTLTRHMLSHTHRQTRRDRHTLASGRHRLSPSLPHGAGVLVPADTAGAAPRTCTDAGAHAAVPAHRSLARAATQWTRGVLPGPHRPARPGRSRGEKTKLRLGRERGP